MGLGRSLGSQFIRNDTSEMRLVDACCTLHLRFDGAILVRKINVHEIGAGVREINPHYRHIRNPYYPNNIVDGSSNGYVVMVSSGLCHVDLGVDSGGFVRMLASLGGFCWVQTNFWVHTSLRNRM
ncbi:hypothetical protein V6N12_031195 [Hibiscus sabdariffa]|uniref:Amidase domain-containing protein n=1 Tax=Hibiscus sabdariffa TaxID=183260 RepID=A0ABR2E8A5_9ROSI